MEKKEVVQQDAPSEARKEDLSMVHMIPAQLLIPAFLIGIPVGLGVAYFVLTRKFSRHCDHADTITERRCGKERKYCTICDYEWPEVKI